MVEKIQQQRFQNTVRTGLLFISLIGLMLVLGFLLVGVQGMIWAGVLGTLGLYATTKVPTDLIMRFYRARKLKPGEAPQLQTIVRQLAERAELETIPPLYYLPSTAINAFATGRRNDPAIAVTYGLLRQLNVRELTGVLAHETSHIVHNDMKLQGMVNLANRITRLFSFVGQIFLIINFPLIFMGEQPIPWLAVLLLLIAPTLSTVITLAISRTREYDADLEAARLTGDPNGLADALQKLNYINRRTNQMPLARKLPEWLSTHPGMEGRIQRLRELAPRFTPRFDWENFRWFLYS